MNPRDIPEVVAELIFEMHEVRSELTAVNGKLDRLNDRVDRLEQTMGQVVEEQRGMRAEMRSMPEQIGKAILSSLEPFLNKILENNDQLKSHEQRLNRLENLKLK